ncbi:hypothetical protein GGR21_000135 [Dysgonomonas hofstadii]|uniref:Starch-binding associating with outer membrane n=1 Tax=Dysgonomonas hofstadii TaxID=637886 RepID=A0A840CE88_9BACT|nr:RagB/SusD family nutrient uptake outer membrane protein [Dysgonomonas hofstadii]MBB4034250.1 hypothetical protein [Dysgonomonas hofstadii]
MKKYIYLLLLCFPVLFLASCNSFESEPLNYNSEDRVLNPGDSTDNSSIKQLFYASYLNLPTLHNRLGNSYLDAATDDALPTATNTTLDYFRNNLVSASNLPDGTAWASGYQGIRRVNLFLSKVGIFPPSAQVPADYIKQMKAEARLLRSYYYFEMLKRWGGVPFLGDRVLTADDDLNIPRASIQEIADYITNEISPDVAGSCYDDLHPAQSVANDDDPDNQGNMIGHVNQGVALALLSRLHLYLASDLYNEGQSGSTISKWQTAASWAKRLIDLGVYDLYVNTSAPFRQFAMESSDFPNKEMIMVKLAGSPTVGLDQYNGPTGYSYTTASGLVNTYGYTSPSQNLVNAFLTLDGKSIYKDYDPQQGYDPSSGYDEQAPYTNRDPRLKRYIFTNGDTWLKTTVETFDGGANRGAQQNLNYTRTGYYLKKFLGNGEDVVNYTAYYRHYQIMRYAEILLNYSEAMNESEPTNDTEIVYGLIELRKRAGIKAGDDGRYGLPAIGTYNQELMRNIIRNERRIELCFEEHRFWDIRRWKIAEDVMNKPVKGVRITKEEDGTFTYSYEDAASSSFLPHMYWYPIPRVELWGNNALEQNPGWSY